MSLQLFWNYPGRLEIITCNSDFQENFCFVLQITRFDIRFCFLLQALLFTFRQSKAIKTVIGVYKDWFQVRLYRYL